MLTVRQLQSLVKGNYFETLLMSVYFYYFINKFNTIIQLYDHFILPDAHLLIFFVITIYLVCVRKLFFFRVEYHILLYIVQLLPEQHNL